jgi:hypothetical protein
MEWGEDTGTHLDVNVPHEALEDLGADNVDLEKVGEIE